MSLLQSAIGEQQPRILHLPTDFDPELSQARAFEMIDVSALAGLVFDPWQELTAEAITRVRSDNKWAALQCATLANRQNGKGSIFEGRQLAGLFVWDERLQVHTAHEFRTAQKHFERIMTLIESTPSLDRLVAKVRRADGEEAIITKSGSALQFMARSLKSGRGITGDTVYLDEAFALKMAMLASLMSTMSARSVHGNPQLHYTSSAGMPESEVLAGIRENGMTGDDPRLTYLEFSAPDDADADDPEVWRKSNPGFGIRISEDFIRAERVAMGDEEFKRERLGIWAKLGGESVIAAADWKACRDEELIAAVDLFQSGDSDLEPENPLDAVAFAVDIPPARDSAVICMAGYRPNGDVYVEMIENGLGTSWVATSLLRLQEKYSPVSIVVDAGSAAGALLPDLKRERVRSKPINMREYGQACGQFFDMVSQHKIRHSGFDELDAAVDAARQAPLGESMWKWTRKNVVTDISPLVGVTLALHGLQTKARPGEARKKKVVVM